MLYIKPASILTGASVLTDSAVLVEGENIVAVGSAGEVPCPPDARRLAADGLLLAPGFIDLQLNGAFGHDFTSDPSTIWEVAARLPRYGVTAFLPTIITSPPETVAATQEVIRHGPPAGFVGTMPLGLHLEGPFLNPQKRGAHNPAYLRLPYLASVEGWSPERGIRLVTLAPELPGALDIIRALRARGVVVGASHSMATAEEGQAGIEAGVTYGTHLFNTMPPLDHRDPGLAGALLTNPRVMAGVIADGVHLHPQVVALIWQVKGRGNVNLVTDGMAALGISPGSFRLGDRMVTVDDTSARLPDGRLAGSVLSLDQAVRNLMRFTGCEPGEAVSTVTSLPAALLGLASSHGRIERGSRADLVLLTPDLQVAATIVAGREAYVK